MSNVRSMFMLVALATILWACGGDKEEALTGNDYLVTIRTDLGEMKAILYDETPKHKENFVKLAKEGFFDSLLFHRVIQGFMIQGGDPNSKNAGPQDRLGNGGPGYTVPAEINPKFFHQKGALSAARQGDQVNPEKASSGSQFYIVQGSIVPSTQLQGPNPTDIQKAVSKLVQQMPDNELNQQYTEAYQMGGNEAVDEKIRETLDQLAEVTGIEIGQMDLPEEMIEAYTTVGGTPFLDNEYTVFGQVISGLDVIDSIAAVATQPGDRPIEDVKMYISVEEMPREEIQSKYNYDYRVQ